MKKTWFAFFVLCLCVFSLASIFGCGSSPTSSGSSSGGGTATYTLGISVNPAGYGTVEVSPTGEVTAYGTREYVSGTVVTVEASPFGYHTFANWSGDISGTSSIETLTMTADASIIANFDNVYYSLGVSVVPTGAGSIEPWGGNYIAGTTAVVTASANTGYTFSSWGGNAIGTSLTTTVLMSGNKSAIANFTIDTHMLTVSVPGGGGTVYPSSGSYDYGTTVTLIATADSGKAFSSWEGTTNNTSNPTTVNMTADRTVKAYFLGIGDSYQGGKIAYLLQSGESNGVYSYDANVPHGFIAALSDQSTGIGWGGYGTTTGATGTALGTGQWNTTTEVSVIGAGSYAAKVCDEYTNTDTGTGVYSDWFLPSKDELNKLYVNRAAIGGLAGNYYWSSTEDDNNNAWHQDSSGGNQNLGYKDWINGVRAIRAF